MVYLPTVDSEVEQRRWALPIPRKGDSALVTLFVFVPCVVTLTLLLFSQLFGIICSVEVLVPGAVERTALPDVISEGSASQALLF